MNMIELGYAYAVALILMVIGVRAYRVLRHDSASDGQDVAVSSFAVLAE